MCVPRTRGDEPTAASRMMTGIGSVPRTRGDEPLLRQHVDADMRVPRTRGDEPVSLVDAGSTMAFPARAGMNRTDAVLGVEPSRRSPHARG